MYRYDFQVVSEALRLPTLKELVGYTPTQTESIAEFASTIAQSSTTFVDRTIGGNALQDEFVDRAVSGDGPEILIKDIANRDESMSDAGDVREAEDGGDKEIFDNDILGSEEIQRRSSSSSFVEGTPYPRTTTDREDIDPEKSIRRVEVPVRILDDANGEEIAELVILRLPESKLNSAILKPVFRVKVLEQDEKSRDDIVTDGNESVAGSNEISSENELPDDRVTSPRRRRVRVDSSSATLGETGRASEDRAEPGSRPRNRQRIVKARRRTRVQEVASGASGEGASIPRETGQASGGEESSGRRESLDAESSSETDAATVQTTESSTAVRATTLRGNVTAPSKAPSVIRGFYVTKSSVEASSTADVATTDSSTDSTRYPPASTGDYGADEATEKTDFPTYSDETVTPFAEGASYIVDESSTYESIGSTVLEPEGETRISNDSLKNVAPTVAEKLETMTTDVISTSDDRFTETGSAATMTDGETGEQPEVTTFRPWTTGEVQTAHPTTLAESTTSEYFTESSSEAIEEESDPTTDHPSESLKTSESSRYGDSPNLVVKSTVSTTIESDDNEGGTASELQTERSARRTTTPSGKTTTHKEPLKRGRVRFTNASKPETSKLSSSEHPRVSTKTSRGESDEQNRTSTETYEKTPEQGSVQTTGSPHASSLRSRDHRRRTTTSLSIDDSTTSSPGKDDWSASSTELYDPPVKYGSRRTSVETTGSSPTSRSFSRSRDHSRGTTKSFKDTSAVTATSTEAYEETGRYTTSSPPGKDDWSASPTELSDPPVKYGSRRTSVETTGSSPTSTSFSRSRDHWRGTTKSFEDTSAVTATSTDAYEETGRYTTSSPPGKDDWSASSTELYDPPVKYGSRRTSVETTGSSPTSRSFSRSRDHSRGTTKSFEDTFAVTATSTDAYEETGRSTTAAEVQKAGTNSVEATGSAQLTSRSDDARQTTETPEDSDDLAIDSTTGGDSTTTSTETSGVEYASTTPEADYLSTNFVGTTGSLFYARILPEETGAVATTTESYDKITETSEPANTVYIADNREEEVRTESTLSIDSNAENRSSNGIDGTTWNLAETTRPWSYLQRNRVTGSASVGNAESIDISNDVTLDVQTDTFPPTTEVYPITDRAELGTRAEDSGTKVNEYGISTESVEKVTETMTSPQTETTLQSFAATTPVSVMHDKSEGTTTTISSQTKIGNVVESSVEESSSTYRGVVDDQSTTESSVRKIVYSTVDSTRNTIAPVTDHRETKRVRGRVRFTNFAGQPDETGRNRRPVKQVVVRRRPVTESNNRQRTVDASSERSTENETLKNSRHPNGQSAEETKNSVEDHERFDEKENSTDPSVRVVGEKNRSTSLSDRSTEEKKRIVNANDRSAEKKKDKQDSARPNDRSAEEKKYSSRVNDRLAGKKYSSRARNRSAERKNSADPNDRSAEDKKNSADPNDRSAEEKKYSSRVNDRSVEKKNSAVPNDRSAEEKKYFSRVNDRSVGKKNSAVPNDRSAGEKKYFSRLNDRSAEKKNSAEPNNRSAEEKNSADPNDRSTEKKNSAELNNRSVEKKNSADPNDRLAEKKNSADPSDRSAEEKTHPSRVNGRLADDNKNHTKSTRRRVIVYRGRPRPEIVTSTTTMQSLRASSDETPDDGGRKRRRKWRKRVVLKRERTEETDDQSIAETVDFRRAVIDPSLADFRDLGSSIEDPELASSAEQADEDNGGEANPYKSSGGFLRRPGSLVRGQGNNRSKTKTPGNSETIILPAGQPSIFSKIQPVVPAQEIKTDDQSGRAQELAVTLADPPIVSSATTGRLPFRTSSAPRKISTTIAPRTEAPATSRTTPLVRRRQRPRGSSSNERIVENVTTRPRRPAIIDYDYYVDDDDIRLVVKPELKDKLFVTRKGGIRCLDQGNFAHPTSCKKFITCARMVNGQVIGTEYTCPDKLSFDPVGGICNWSAGLGCEDNKKP